MRPIGATPSVCHEAFDRYGYPGARSPLVFAVPHAGRDYVDTVLDRARVTPATLARLEDRLADLLTHDLIAAGECVLIARRPRAMIDLNRDESEIDPQSIADLPRTVRPQSSAKVRGGLGLIPDRLAYAGALWRHPLPYAELVRRIEQIHRPYHAALAAALNEARARHGAALLVDVHSMPPIHPASGAGDQPPRIVIGDRFGRSATGRLTDLAADIARGHGLEVAVNTPYSGNHILERHGQPARGVHAMQIEIDRTLYLAPDLMTPDGTLPAIRRLLGDLAQGLAQELSGPGLQLAAE
ncbi:MAG: N-formylglutamate amidohydrolase [Sphingobium sp.]|nr:N-formylglutamate amidohydrolase [Sphingobium sp.]